MKSKLQFFIALVCSLSLFVSCNNDSSTTTTEDSTQSSTTQSSDTQDTMSTMTNDTMSHNNMNSGMMSSMQSSMQKMQGMSMTGDFDVDFANMMVEHHQGGIDMAQMEISQGKDEKMKSMAQKISSDQKKEQQELRDFVASYKPSGMKHGEGELQKSMSSAMDQMKSMQMSGDTDKDFATMMMHHHEHGVAMAKKEVEHGMSSKLKGMAQKSITKQNQEIKEFKNWLDSKK
jgi:uncharacterized protein (DUF305 family)